MRLRYIITVNALKRDWDCQFAYILALAKKSLQKIDVEADFGRVLRLPYAKQQPTELLNLSYVFTCQAHFQETFYKNC